VNQQVILNKLDEIVNGLRRVEKAIKDLSGSYELLNEAAYELKAAAGSIELVVERLQNEVKQDAN